MYRNSWTWRALGRSFVGAMAEQHEQQHLDTRAAAAHLGLDPRYLERMRLGANDDGPPHWKPADHSNSRVMYPIAGLDAWTRRRAAGGVQSVAELIVALEKREAELREAYPKETTPGPSWMGEGRADGMAEALSRLRAFESPTPT